MKTFILFSILSTSLLLAECNFSYKNEAVEFKAYKTLAKLGVAGKFDTVDVDAKKSNSLESLLLSTSLNIDTFSVNSNHEARDKTLVKSFFKVQDVKNIDAKVLSVKGDTVNVVLTLNSVTKTIPMKLSKKDSSLEVNGVIDLGDFDMLNSLKSINKACYELHNGKTWQDVAISFKADVSKVCK